MWGVDICGGVVCECGNVWRGGVWGVECGHVWRGGVCGVWACVECGHVWRGGVCGCAWLEALLCPLSLCVVLFV